MATTSCLSSLERRALIDKIDAILPQTQCEKCGHPGCKPYAVAIVDGTADINQCPPGGERGIHDLAHLLGRPFRPLNPLNGVEKPKTIAVIDEAVCIGCTLCIQACPVDAIAGAAKQMHTVIARTCTGCELCVAPCPVDCIAMMPALDASGRAVTHIPRAEADAARWRFEFRNARIEREKQARADMIAARSNARSSATTGNTTTGNTTISNASSMTDMPTGASDERKKALIAAALARVNAQKQKDAAAQALVKNPNDQNQE